MNKVIEATFIIVVTLIAAVGIGMFVWIGFGSTSPSPTQTASAEIDYFSWSCQQLEESVNQSINSGDSSSTYGATTYYGYAIALENIMQLKGCAE